MKWRKSELHYSYSYYIEKIISIFPLLTSVFILYAILIVLFYTTRYVRTYTYNKRLIFTRDSIKELRKEIDDVLYRHGDYDFLSKGQYLDDSISLNPMSKGKQIEIVMSLYNELAVGINEGLYDELYVKIIIGRQMTVFYKKFYKTIMENNTKGDESLYIPLELLLRKWDSKDAPTYREKNRRGFL